MNAGWKAGAGFRVHVILSLAMLVVIVVVAGTYPGSKASGAAATAIPKVTAMAQVTHDGLRKTGLIADDEHLYVTEWPGASRVIAKIAVPGGQRTVITEVAGKVASTASSATASSSYLTNAKFSKSGSSYAATEKSSSIRLSNLGVLDVSPDGKTLLVASKASRTGDDEFWTMPLKAGTPERVGDLSGRDADWSVDGKDLAYGKGSVLYLTDSAGSEAHALYGANGSVFAPRFSPDGQRIRFSVSNAEENTTSLWEVGRDGSNPHELLTGWPYKTTACCGSWTADGRYYIFQATQTLPNTTTIITALWAMDGVDVNAAPAQLTGAPMSFGNVFPARDNKNIWAIGVQPAGEVVKYDPRAKKYVPVLAGVSATDLDFSADDKWVTYVTVPDGALWRSRANGTERLQLTPAGERAALPHWSPDGKQIAYVSMQPGDSWKISLVPTAGGKAEPILSEDGSQIDANWSPDGMRLMFGDFAHDAGGLSIRVLDLKTHATTIIPGSKGLFSPRWSPDGRYIAALSPDNTALMLFDFNTQAWSKWLAEQGTVNYPVWSADSKYLYFDDFVSGAESIRRVKVGESEPQLVFELGAIERYPGQLGLWTGRAADGSWMFVRDRSTQEVYQLSMELP
jgi:Tol biopolymer transport system component